MPHTTANELPPPSPWLLALEFRAPWEASLLVPAWPSLLRAPRGDGHDVIVFPGLSASDSSTAALRLYLDAIGYRTRGWGQGFNFGPRAGVLPRVRELIEDTHAETGRKVSLIGWSLGGIYAREMAKLLSDRVRCVITLGTPFAGTPRSTNAWRIYELTSGRSSEREAHQFDLPAAPPVPTTSIYSRTDGIVAWKGSIQARCTRNPHTENIEVHASHVGIGVNPAAYWAVADRLAQSEGQWRPFMRPSSQGPGATPRRPRATTRWIQGFAFPDPSR